MVSALSSKTHRTLHHAETDEVMVSWHMNHTHNK